MVEVILLVLKIENTRMPEKQVKEAVLKALKIRIEKINQKLIPIHENMLRFQSKYGLKNQEFHEKYVKGELGDDMDLMEWKVSLEIYDELQEEKRALLEAIG